MRRWKSTGRLSGCRGARRNASEVESVQTVHVGSWVQVRDVDGEIGFTLTVPAEADPFAGCVSAESPLGRALIGHQAGDEVTFRAPGGVLAVTVVDVC
jgi:transcription elongation factor GreA